MTPAVDRTPRTADRPAFAEEATEILQQLRAALLRLLNDLPGAPIRRAADLERRLEIGSTVAWQVHRATHAPDPVSVGLQAPGVAAMRSVLQAAARKGVAAESVAALESVLNRLDRLIREEAGDRATFNSMLKSVAADSATRAGAGGSGGSGHAGGSAHAGSGRGGQSGEELIGPAHRRAAFRSNSVIWGVQARVGLWCTLYHPGSERGLLQSANVRGFLDLRRLRANAPCTMSRFRSLRAHGERVSSEPLLLSEFSSADLPLQTSVDTDGFHVTEFPPGPIGNQSRATYYLANFSPEAPWYEPDREKQVVTNFVRVRIPIETLVLDTLCHHELFGHLNPEVIVYGSIARMSEIDPERFSATERLPVAASATYVGRGAAAVHCADVPNYAEMLEHVCRHQGWGREGGVGLDAFDVYRCRVEYPVHTAVHAMHFEFDAQPGEAK